MPSMLWRGVCALAPESKDTRPGVRSEIGDSRRTPRVSHQPLRTPPNCRASGEQMARLPAGGAMSARGDDVYLGAAADDKGAVEPAMRIFAHADICLMPDTLSGEQQGEAREPGAFAQSGLGLCEVHCRG